MERLLLFAPRAYFSSGCNHNSYMTMCRMIIYNIMGALRTAFPNFDTREITRDTTAIIEGFDTFISSLRESPRCTRREYMAKVREIIDPFRAALNQLSDDLCAIEYELKKVKPGPKTGRKYKTYKVSVRAAAKLTGIPAVTLYRILLDPKNSLAPVLDHSPEAVIRWGEDYKKTHKVRKARKHEANMMNHPIPMSSLSKGSRHKTGV